MLSGIGFSGMFSFLSTKDTHLGVAFVGTQDVEPTILRKVAAKHHLDPSLVERTDAHGSPLALSDPNYARVYHLEMLHPMEDRGIVAIGESDVLELQKAVKTAEENYSKAIRQAETAGRFVGKSGTPYLIAKSKVRQELVLKALQDQGYPIASIGSLTTTRIHETPGVLNQYV